MSRYNVLEVISDQHNAACVGHEGHAQAITPHMDRLAGEGVRFPRAYTANPICTPTRVSVLSGQYCHNHGYYGLGGPTPQRLPDWLGHFHARGYRTAAVGKIHLPNRPRSWIADSVDLLADLSGHHPGNPHYRAGVAEGFAHEIDHGSIPELPGGQQQDARASSLAFRQTVEGFANTEAMRFIDACGDEPWAMQVSYHRPHQCYTPAKPFWDLYPEDLALPPGWADADLGGRPPHFRAEAESGRALAGHYEPTDPEARARRVWRGYLGCISMVDHALGELLDHLEARGLADRTIVVYHSDHGAYSGTFGLPEKAPGICSEQVCRVPMIWRVPGVTPADHASEQFAHNVDLAPTLVSLCGLDAMDSTDGIDLTPLLRGEERALRDVAVTENPWSKALRFGRWRFVHYQPEMFDGEDVGELYDVEADPLETKNLYHDPAHREVVERGRRLLCEWLIRTARPTTVHPPLGKEPEQGGDGTLANDFPIAARRNRNYL